MQNLQQLINNNLDSLTIEKNNLLIQHNHYLTNIKDNNIILIKKLKMIMSTFNII
jgi:hypothetical protein